MDMHILKDSFNSSITSNMDVELKTYMDGYEQLCNFCTLMGTLFGFVSDEIMNKMGVLRQLQSSEYKEHFKTMKGMIGYERSSNLLYKSGYTSGSRTLLRLHRGLGFLLMFLTKVHQLKMTDSTREAGRDAYDKMLAPYHSWFVRSGATVAMYSLPTKEVMIRRICLGTNASQCTSMFPDILAGMNKVYRCVQSHYEENGLLNLP